LTTTIEEHQANAEVERSAKSIREPACCSDRRHRDSDELTSLSRNVDVCWRSAPMLDHEFEPELGFISLLLDDPHFQHDGA
jgi:hypothetical protein